jgi:hypothetical protein
MLDVSDMGLTDVAEAFLVDDDPRAMVLIDAHGWRTSLSISEMIPGRHLVSMMTVDPEDFGLMLTKTMDVLMTSRTDLLEWMRREAARLLHDLIFDDASDWMIDLRPAKGIVFVVDPVGLQRTRLEMPHDDEIVRRQMRPTPFAFEMGDDHHDGTRTLELRFNKDLIHPWRRKAARELVRSRPWIAALTPTHLSAIVGHIVRDGMAARDLTPSEIVDLVRRGFGPGGFNRRSVLAWTAAGIRNADRFRVTADDRAIDYIALVSRLPPSWMPRTIEEHLTVYFATPIVQWAASFGVDDPVLLLKGCKGRWSEYMDRLGIDGTVPNSFRTRLGEIGDMLEDIKNQIVNPIVTRDGRTPGMSLFSTGPNVGEMAMTLATRDGGLHLLSQKSDVWHARQGRLPSLDGTKLDQSWPALTPPFEASNGVFVEFLLDAQVLTTEGKAMRHCVGSYAKACATGSSHVASLSRRVGRKMVRLSTVEIRMEGNDARIHQHYGACNSQPHADAFVAMEEWIASMSSGRLRPDAKAMVRRDRPETVFRIPEDGSPSDWKGILQPRLARMGWEELIAEIDDMARSGMPTSSRAPRRRTVLSPRSEART